MTRMIMMLGREVRRVPMDWEQEDSCFGEFYELALEEWLERKRKWDAGEDPDREKYGKQDMSFPEWDGGPPNPEYYWPGRAWPEGVEMGIQMYETVSEGSPVSAVHPDTPEGRLALAEDWASGDSSISSSMTIGDRLETINAQLGDSSGGVFGTDIQTGRPVHADD